MNNVSKLGVKFRCMVGRQVAHGSAVTVFLRSCETDSQWTVNFFMQVKPAALSSLRLAGLDGPTFGWLDSTVPPRAGWT